EHADCHFKISIRNHVQQFAPQGASVADQEESDQRNQQNVDRKCCSEARQLCRDSSRKIKQPCFDISSEIDIRQNLQVIAHPSIKFFKIAFDSVRDSFVQSRCCLRCERAGQQ